MQDIGNTYNLPGTNAKMTAITATEVLILAKDDTTTEKRNKRDKL